MTLAIAITALVIACIALVVACYVDFRLTVNGVGRHDKTKTDSR